MNKEMIKQIIESITTINSNKNIVMIFNNDEKMKSFKDDILEHLIRSDVELTCNNRYIIEANTNRIMFLIEKGYKNRLRGFSITDLYIDDQIKEPEEIEHFLYPQRIYK